MKAYAKLALLVALVLLLTLTACTRSATTRTAAVVPTSTGEAPFPFTTPNAGGSVTDFGTQTAVARTPQVLLATTTPAPGEQPAPEATAEPVQQGGGQPEGTEAGGGVTEPQQPEQQQPPVSSADLTPVERPATYTIQKGEHPFCIARRYNVDPNALLSANGLGRNSLVSIGTTLTIPATSEWSIANYGSRSLQAHPTTYTVASGDTVNGIACKFGDVYPEHILQANNLGSPADVQAGMTLSIP